MEGQVTYRLLFVKCINNVVFVAKKHCITQFNAAVNECLLLHVDTISRFILIFMNIIRLHRNNCIISAYTSSEILTMK